MSSFWHAIQVGVISALILYTLSLLVTALIFFFTTSRYGSAARCFYISNPAVTLTLRVARSSPLVRGCLRMLGLQEGV